MSKNGKRMIGWIAVLIFMPAITTLLDGDLWWLRFATIALSAAAGWKIARCIGHYEDTTRYRRTADKLVDDVMLHLRDDTTAKVTVTFTPNDSRTHFTAHTTVHRRGIIDMFGDQP